MPTRDFEALSQKEAIHQVQDLSAAGRLSALKVIWVVGQFAERPLSPSGVAATGHGPERGRTRPSVERRQGPPWTDFAGPENPSPDRNGEPQRAKKGVAPRPPEAGGRARPHDFAGPPIETFGGLSADGGASEATRRGPGAMGSAKRCKDVAARCRSPVGDPSLGEKAKRSGAKTDGAARGRPLGHRQRKKGGAKRSKNGVARRRPPRPPPQRRSGTLPPEAIGDSISQ